MEAKVTIKNNTTISDCDINQLHAGVGDNIKFNLLSVNKTFLDHLLSWCGVLGTTATLAFGLLSWYALHIQMGFWFFFIERDLK